MAYQQRGSTPTNTIKLTFDFDTLDKLRSCAALRKVALSRCAYELIQEGLGLREAPPAAEPETSAPDAPAFDWGRVTAFKPPNQR